MDDDGRLSAPPRENHREPSLLDERRRLVGAARLGAGHKRDEPREAHAQHAGAQRGADGELGLECRLRASNGDGGAPAALDGIGLERPAQVGPRVGAVGAVDPGELELLRGALLLAHLGEAAEEAAEEQRRHVRVGAAAMRVGGGDEGRHATHRGEGGGKGGQPRLGGLGGRGGQRGVRIGNGGGRCEAAGDGAVGGVVGIGQRGGIDECVGGVGEDVGEVVAHEETEGEAVAQPDAQIMHAEAADGADGSDPREEAVGRGGGVRSEREQLAGEADARLGALGRAARQLDLARDGVGGGELGQYAAREQRPEHVERRLAMPVDEELHLPLEVLARHVVGRRGQRPRLRHAVDGKLDVSQLVGARGGGHAHRRHETHGDGGCRGAGCSGRAVGAARAVAPLGDRRSGHGGGDVDELAEADAVAQVGGEGSDAKVELVERGLLVRERHAEQAEVLVQVANPPR